MSEPQGRRKNGLGFRIERFFIDNPTEELTYVQLAAKFDCSVCAARWAVKELIKRRDIESVHVIRLRVKGIAE